MLMSELGVRVGIRIRVKVSVRDA